MRYSARKLDRDLEKCVSAFRILGIKLVLFIFHGCLVFCKNSVNLQNSAEFAEMPLESLSHSLNGCYICRPTHGKGITPVGKDTCYAFVSTDLSNCFLCVLFSG